MDLGVYLVTCFTCVTSCFPTFRERVNETEGIYFEPRLTGHLRGLVLHFLVRVQCVGRDTNNGPHWKGHLVSHVPVDF